MTGIGLVEEDARAREEVLERLRPEGAAAGGDEAVALGVLPGAIADRDVEVAPVPGGRGLPPVRHRLGVSHQLVEPVGERRDLLGLKRRRACRPELALDLGRLERVEGLERLAPQHQRSTRSSSRTLSVKSARERLAGGANIRLRFHGRG